MLWLGLIEKEQTEVSPLITTIKRGILCMQLKEYDKAEIIFHLALSLAQQQDFEEAEMYIYDMLANNSYEKQDYEKAEKLFIQVLSRYLSMGHNIGEEAVVEISLKLAMIYSKKSKLDKANEGFRFCLDSQKTRIKNLVNQKIENFNEKQINSLALWAMCLDWYAKHLVSIGKFKLAIEYYNQSLDVCIKINGFDHPQTLVLQNDIATVLMFMNEVDKAIDCMKKVIKEAIKIDSEDLGTFYYNLGKIYLMQSNFSQAQFACRESLNFAKQLNDKVLIDMAMDCLNKSKT